MKKILLSALGALLALPGFAFTYEYEGKTLFYRILDEEARTCEVEQNQDYKTFSGNIVIPQIAKDGDTEYTVTGIGYQAFGWCPSLSSVTIPESVTSIGEYAFSSCSSLTSVTIPESVTSISSGVFSSCSSLTSVTIPESVASIEEETFSGCRALTSITIPESVTSIGGHAFSDCRALTSITIPESVTSIGNSAFGNCESLTSIKIPESVTSISSGLFFSCSSLTSVTIPESVTSIGGHAFSDCRALTSITIPESVTSIGESAFSSCSSLTSITIPESVTLISSGVFSYCSSLTSVTIPGSVISIGESAFSHCYSLSSITIPESVTSIGESAFFSCSSLTSVTIPNSVITIEKHAFDSCCLVTVKLSDALVSIGEGAFQRNNFSEIILPESLKTIGDECFRYCPLTTVRFGQNIERIGGNAFSTLSQFEANGNLVSLGDKAFGENFRLLKISRDNPPQLDSKNMGYTEDEAYNILVIVPANGDDVYKNDPKWEGFHIVETAPTKTVYMTGKYSLAEEITTTTQQMPGNVTSLAIVGPLADDDWNIIKRNLISCYDLDLSGVTNTEIPAETFADNKHILTLRLPAGLKTIGDRTFSGCNNLTMEALPTSVETIGESAFENCTVFNVNELPESLRTIGVKAFANCSRLQISALPAVETIGAGAFYNCPRFMDLDMSAAKFTVIEAGTFANCGKLRNITLPETLTAIKGSGEFWSDSSNMGAFQNTAVNFVAFPGNLREIGGNAFRNTALISVELPRQFNAVDKGSFAECPMIKSISLSSKMQSIGEEAFLDCRGIKSISVPCAVPPTVGDKAFSNVRYRDVVVSIPTMNYRDYLNALGWGAFTQLANSIFLEYEEVDENGDSLSEDEAEEDNVEVGAVENGTYDEIVNNIVSEEEQAAEDKARDEALYGDEPVAQAEIAARVKRARAAARAEAEYTADAKARKAFSRLYTGQSMTIGDNTGYRVKIQPKEGVEIVKIEFGGKDITDTYIDGMVTLPALYSRSSLKVYRRSTNVGVENVSGSDRNTTADVYNLQGIVVLRDATEAQVSRLNPGMYIYKGRKIVIR